MIFLIRPHELHRSIKFLVLKKKLKLEPSNYLVGSASMYVHMV